MYQFWFVYVIFIKPNSIVFTKIAFGIRRNLNILFGNEFEKIFIIN